MKRGVPLALPSTIGEFIVAVPLASVISAPPVTVQPVIVPSETKVVYVYNYVHFNDRRCRMIVIVAIPVTAVYEKKILLYRYFE